MEHSVDTTDNEIDPPKRPVRIGTFWHKPPMLTYPSNFGFAINGYQPMIDYLDAKDRGGKCNKKDIYLPFLEERCMDQYSSDKPYRKYTNVDIDNYIEKGDDIIRQIRQNDAIGHGSVLNRTHTNWSMTKKWVQMVKKSQVIDYRKIREERLAEEARDAPISVRTNKRRGRSSQRRSRTPSVTRRGSHSQTRSSGTPVRTRSSSVVHKRGANNNNKMVQTQDGVLSTLAHNKLDHELNMAARRDRLDELDSQFENVIENLASSLSRLNRRSNSTVYDEESANDVILDNKLRRREELARITENVDELTSADRARRSRSAVANVEIDDMNDRLNNISQRQRNEREADLDALTALSQAAAAYAARKRISRDINLVDVEDADVDYLRKRNSAVKQKITVEKPKRKSNFPDASKFSDVHARVINKASAMSSMSAVSRRINNKARYINIYTPKPETGDQDLIVKPSRTEMNIDNMAKSFVERGKMSRRYAIDDEVDPPVSSLNTNAHNTYHNREVQRTIPEVPSNSSRVRYAVIRARARNTILGY